MRFFLLCVASSALLLPGCGSDETTAHGSGATSTSASAGATSGAGGGAGGSSAVSSGTGNPGACGEMPVGGDRPAKVLVPAGYDPGTPAPVLVMLHGYTASGDLEESYLQIAPVADAKGVIYVHPDGLKDSVGNGFWNATDACCAFAGPMVDDSAYVSALIAEIQSTCNVDPKRIFVMGHSNGGFMSYRMACDHADTIAAIASLAGAMWLDTSQCKPAGPVSVLEIHGTKDGTIGYEGGANLGKSYPSAPVSIGDWVTFDGCDATGDTSAPNIDLEANLAGAETTVTKYAKGCKGGSGVELWSIQEGGHIPAISAEFTSDFVDWLLAHPKP